MMYSPEVGGAAPCEASAKIENKTTNQRRFISAAKGLFMRRAKLRKWEVDVAAVGDRGRRLQQTCFHLSAHQILPSLPFSNQLELVAAYQRLCGQRTRIVIRSHHKSVGTSAHDCEQIALAQLWHLPIQRKEITRLAYRPDDIDLFRSSFACAFVLTLAHNFTLTWRFASASPFEGEGWGEGARLFDGHNFMIAVIQRRPNEIVHSSIHNGKFLRA